MRKRIIALLLALILTVGLLPTVALAADGENPTTDSGSVTKEASKDNLNLVKTVTKEGDNYKVTLESWATGTVTSSSTPVPMDIILLLDQSGSMKKNFTSSSTETYNNLNKKNKKIYADYRNNCYIKSGNQYLKVTVTYQWEFGFSNDVYTYTWNGGSHTSTGGNSKPKIPLFYKSTTNSSTTRIAALKTAVSSFINKVNTEATTKNVDHRVAVVGFASTRSDYYENTELLSTPDVVNYGSANNIDYRNALVSAKTNKNKLDTAINRLAASGDTYPEYGFDMANQIFAQYPIQAGENRQRVVIMFTDGYPAPANTDNFNAGMVNNAINNAKRCKDNNAKVYTIGIFDGADPSASIENYLQNQGVAANRYMHFSSSNYPSAMALNNGGTRGEGNFYFAASNADALNDIFDTISEEISTDTTELDGSATIIDNIPGNFAIPEGAQDITLKVAEFQKGGTFATATAAPTTVTAEHKDGTVTVTGFNFSDEWCGLDENDRPHGSKLIIEFTIHHNNYGGTQPTNAGASIKDKEGNEVIKVDDPAIPVKITEPSITGASATKVYDGTGIDVLENVAVEADKLVTGENEGKNAFVDIIVKVKDANNVEYTYTIPAGATTGSWDKENVEFKTPADVKIESDGSVGKYSYDLSIIYQDKAQTNPAAPKTVTVKAEYTITKRPVTLTSGSDEKKYDGSPLTKHEVTASTGEGVGFVGGDGATYTFTGSQTEPGESDNEFEYTLIGETKATNYEITKQLGKLKVTKDDTEITVTIIGKQETKEYNGQAQTVTGFTYTVEGAGHDDVTVTLKENQKAEASGKDVKTVNDGKYSMNLTSDMFDVSSTKYSNVKITTVTDGWLKITPLAVTLTSESATQEYNGNALTRPTVSVTGAGAERFQQEVENLTANGTVTGTADMIEAQSVTNDITYTWKEGFSASNYTITTTPGTLTITPIAQLKITFKTELGGKIDGGTADIEKTAKRNDPFPTIPTPTPNTSYYFDGWYKDNTKVTSFPEKVTENATYTAKWLSYNSINLDLTGKIQKTLNSDVELSNQRFTINVKQTGAEVASATATATVSPVLDNGSYTDTKPFVVASGDFKLTFTAPGIYNYSIVEEDGQLAGMTYDVNRHTTTGHTMTVVVDEGAEHALSVTRVTVDGTAIALTDTAAAWLTINNEYKTPSTGTVTKKTIRSDMYDGMDKGIWATLFGDKGAFISTSDTIVVDKNTNEVTLAYEVSIVGEATATAKVEDDGAEYVTYDSTVDGVNVNYDETTKIATVTFAKAATAKLYYVKTFTRENGEFATAKNFVTVNDGEPVPSDETTITDKEPGSFDFSEIIRKELKLTGSKSFTGTEFEATLTLKDFKQEVLFNSMLTAYAAEHVEAWPKGWSRTLVAKFDSTAVDGSTTNFLTTDGNHLFLDFPAAGTYKFELQETNKTRTNVTYDDTVYTIVVKVTTDKEHQNYDKLVVTGIGVEYVDKDGNKVTEDIYIGDEAIGKVMTFVNTVDTGKDDYYPIIIPTIINKDTGMLNKTDHFAYVIGYPDGTVHPNGQITRAEVATIFFRLLRDEVRDGAFTTSNTYSDVAYGKWYNNPISTMSALGIITGYPDGTFKPNKPITRAEFAAIAARFDETQSGKSATFSDVIGHWAAKEIGIAYYNDWIKGYPDGTFKPDQNITRAEAMTLINRVLERKPESPADLLTNMNKWTDNMDTSKWYYLDVQEATNSHGYTRKTFNYELWRQMLPDPDWSRYER